MKKPMKTDHYGQVMTTPDGSTMREDVITGVAKEQPSSGSERRPCSPSLHPETDAIWEQNRDSCDPAKIEGDLLAHAEKLEQERDEARRAAIRWQDAWTNETTLHEMGSTLMPWWRDWKKSEENDEMTCHRK